MYELKTRPTIAELEKIISESNDDLKIEVKPDGSIYTTDETKTIDFPDPTPEMLDDPLFNKIWDVIKTWDINVPGAYSAYRNATGNHVRAILDGIRN